MNFGLPKMTKQKKKPWNTTKCHTKKNPRNTTKCHNIFSIFFISSCGRSQFNIIILFFTPTTFSQQIYGENLLLVLKLCIKKKKKDNTRKLCETAICGSTNLTILKKKKRLRIQQNITTFSQYLHFQDLNIYIYIYIFFFFLREMLHP